MVFIAEYYPAVTPCPSVVTARCCCPFADHYSLIEFDGFAAGIVQAGDHGVDGCDQAIVLDEFTEGWKGKADGNAHHGQGGKQLN